VRYILKTAYRYLIFFLPQTGLPRKRYQQRIFLLACLFAVFSSVVFFAGLFLQYNAIRKSTYISVTELDGCEPVSSTVNGDYLFDANGNWETSNKFDPDQALYTVSFSTVRVNAANYSTALGGLRDQLKASAVEAPYYTTSQLLVFFSTYVKRILPKSPGMSNVFENAESLITISTVSDPTYMFHGRVNNVPNILFSSNGTATTSCRKLHPEIDMQAGVVRILYRDNLHGKKTASDFESYKCDQIISMRTFGYETSAALDAELSAEDSRFPFNATVISPYGPSPPQKPKVEQITLQVGAYQDLQFRVDLTAAVVAIAINCGFLLPVDLASVTVSDVFFVPTGYSGYIYPKFPDMDIIMCKLNALELTGNSFAPLCLVPVDSGRRSSFALPVMNSLASNPFGVIYDGLCECQATDPADPAKTRVNVQQYRDQNTHNYTRGVSECTSDISFSYGFVSLSLPPGSTYNSSYAEVFANKFASYVMKPQYFSNIHPNIPYYQFMRATYNASVIPSDCNPGSDEYNTFVAKAFDFCDGECFVIAVSYYGVTSTLASNSVSIAGASCTTKLFPKPKAWQNIQENPPVPLLESYYHCTTTPVKAFATALGLAYGLLGFAMQTFALILLPVLVYAMEFSGVLQTHSHLGDEYDADDKRVALDELALQLLRIRDGDMRGFVPDGELVRFTKEFIANSKAASLIDAHDFEQDGHDVSSQGSLPAAGAANSELNGRLSARIFLDIERESSIASAGASAVITNKGAVVVDNPLLYKKSKGTVPVKPEKTPANVAHDSL